MKLISLKTCPYMSNTCPNPARDIPKDNQSDISHREALRDGPGIKSEPFCRPG